MDPASPPLVLSLDRQDESVRQGGKRLKLTPRAFAVLRRLMDNAGQLVTKDELLAAVWHDAAVTDASLTTCVREIRRALNDDPLTPVYIQTVHRRGYRYLSPPVSAAVETETDSAGKDASPSRLVGRDWELASLDRCLRESGRGDRRVVFIAGEPGIGKTALVETFLQRSVAHRRSRIARGQCVEQYGAGEAYLPWLEMLDQMGRDEGVVQLLRRYAPMWLAQMPWLIGPNERERLQREIVGTTRERMVRELAEALEALSETAPLVLVLEDIHWSDQSSIGLLSYIARRREPARLLLLGTYRPAEVMTHGHPLMAIKQELRVRGQCEELALNFLSPEAVVEFVAARLPGAPEVLAHRIHRRTDGNPLFMISVIDYLVARGAVAEEGGRWFLNCSLEETESDVPQNLKEMIERHVERLAPADQRMLEDASLAGVTFCVASLAAAIEEPAEATEERLWALASRGSLVRRIAGQVWPDGTQTDSYSFIHALYQDVLHEKVGSARRVRVHNRMGSRLEAAYGDRAGDIAAELARHFQLGGDAARAARYLAQAGENAIRRSAFFEAIGLLGSGLDVLRAVPEGRPREALELQLQVPLGVCLMNTSGYASPDVERTFRRSYELCRRVPDTSRLYRVLRGLWSYSVLSANLQTARSVAEELLLVADREGDPSGLVEGHRIMATTWFHLGNFRAAGAHLERGIALYDPQHHSSHAFLFGQDPGVSCLCWHALTEWHLGRPDRAITSGEQAIELARQIGHPFSQSYAMNFMAMVHQFRHEPDLAARCAAEGMQCAREQGLTQMVAMGEILHAWGRANLGGGDAAVTDLRRGLALWRSTGSRLVCPYWSGLLASALHEAGKIEEAMTVLADAMSEADAMEEVWFRGELYILNGSLMSARAGSVSIGADTDAEAQRWLRRALETAEQMSAPSVKLRAATRLGCLLHRQKRSQDARALLAPIYAECVEGLDTPQLKEAASLLSRL